MAFDDVEDYLAQLRSADWLENVGQRAEPSVVALGTWQGAEKEVARRLVQDELIDAANAIRDCVRYAQPVLMDKWNPFVERIKPGIIDLVDMKLSPDAAGRRVGRAMHAHIQWIVLHAAIEIYFDDVSPPKWNRLMASWLRRGHLPIRWTAGQFPKGHAVVF